MSQGLLVCIVMWEKVQITHTCCHPIKQRDWNHKKSKRIIGHTLPHPIWEKCTKKYRVGPWILIHKCMSLSSWFYFLKLTKIVYEYANTICQCSTIPINLRTCLIFSCLLSNRIDLSIKRARDPNIGFFYDVKVNFIAP